MPGALCKFFTYSTGEKSHKTCARRGWFMQKDREIPGSEESFAAKLTGSSHIKIGSWWQRTSI